MFEQLEETKKNSYTINEHSPEYKLGIKEGKLQERGNWVQVLNNTKEIDDSQQSHQTCRSAGHTTAETNP